jgi:putative hydrolase of the HAD superfamily
VKIVFDFGGVLVGWQPRRLLRRALPHIVTDDAAAARWALQFFQGEGGDWDAFDRGAVTPEALVKRIARRTGLAEADVQRVIDAVPDELQPQPETVALLRRLHAAGRALYFLSNMPAPYARHLQASHDFMALFSGGVFSSAVGHNKPEAAIFEIAAQRFGHPPHELLFLDDHEANVAAAQHQGWQSLHFRGAAAAEAELRRRGLLGAID